MYTTELKQHTENHFLFCISTMFDTAQLIFRAENLKGFNFLLLLFVYQVILILSLNPFCLDAHFILF